MDRLVLLAGWDLVDIDWCKLYLPLINFQQKMIIKFDALSSHSLLSKLSYPGQLVFIGSGGWVSWWYWSNLLVVHSLPNKFQQKNGIKFDALHHHLNLRVSWCSQGLSSSWYWSNLVHTTLQFQQKNMAKFNLLGFYLIISLNLFD